MLIRRRKNNLNDFLLRTAVTVFPNYKINHVFILYSGELEFLIDLGLKFKIISGAKYSGVPHNVYDLVLTIFAKPKSVNFKYPSLSKSRFSGFKSLYTIS